MELPFSSSPSKNNPQAARSSSSSFPNYNSIIQQTGDGGLTPSLSSSPKDTTRRKNNNTSSSSWQQQRRDSSVLDSNSSSSSSEENAAAAAAAAAAGHHHKTTAGETLVHLLKGYIGTGCLSLPWALSQLGILIGVLAILLISAWTSYNCWTVVKLKRIVEQHLEDDDEDDDNDNAVEDDTEGAAAAAAAPDTASENRSIGASAATASVQTSVTYPVVGHWAYGKAFEHYVTYSVCIQQLAICTVYFSFVGENVLALLQYFELYRLASSHVGVVSASLPIILILSFIPTLRQLSPVMMAGTITLFTGFAVILYLVVLEWDVPVVEPATFHWNQAPLALCGILYSFEGICLILPVESAMKEPQHFQRVFTGSMILVAAIFASFASLCAYSFGNVTNGSITAFLLQAFSGDSSIIFWIMVANAFVSVSVILSYPLMLLPALELIASQISHAGKEWDIMVHGGGNGRNNDDDDDDKDLSPFEPLPPLPEHDVASLGEEDFPQEHTYEIMSSNLADNDDNKNDDNVSEDGATTMSILTAMIIPEMKMPGDSPQLRTGLVFMTFVIAILIPNVQSLISLAGALAGTSTALLIPPLMELAWIRQLERGVIDIAATTSSVHAAAGREIALGGSTRNIGAGRQGFLFDKIKCYVLFTMGLVLGLVGSYASIQDIVQSYSGSAQ